MQTPNSIQTKVTPVTKTPEQRRAELKDKLDKLSERIDTPAATEMPPEVLALVDQIEGLQVSDLRPEAIPTRGEWRGYMSKKTGLPGWSCIDGFSGKVIPLAEKGSKYSVAVKITVSIFETKAR